MNDIIFLFWFFLPTIIANMVPVFVARLPGLRNWSYPMDAYFMFRGHRVFGDHKTIRGFIAGTGVAIIIAVLQFALANHWSALQNFLPLYYKLANPLVLGFLLGFGALAGDAVKSFFKRQFGIPDGRSWFPFDQLDSVLGALVAVSFYLAMPWYQYIYVIIGGLIIHLLIVFIGYLIGMREHII